MPGKLSILPSERQYEQARSQTNFLDNHFLFIASLNIYISVVKLLKFLVGRIFILLPHFSFVAELILQVEDLPP